MDRRLAWRAVCALTFVAAAPPAADEDIVVNGVRRTPAEVRAEAVDFVQALGIAAGSRPAARWIDPVCVKVGGVEPPVAAVVERALREAATAARVPLARGSCETNLAIRFVGDAPALMRGISDRAPSRLAEVARTRRADLIEGTAPVRWWYTTEVRERDGGRPTGNPPAGAIIEGAGPLQIPDGATGLTRTTSSVASTMTKRALRTATVIVDVNLASGTPLSAVAALAAFVGLAEIAPDANPAARSILNLFAPGGPRALTGRDRALLASLYRLPLDREARRHRNRLVKDLVEAGPEG